MQILPTILSVIALLIAIAAALSAKRTTDASEAAANAAERSAQAAERQANAVAPQLEAAQSAAEAAQLQVEIAVKAAEEAKRIAELSQAHMRASLRPVLILERTEDGYWGVRYYLFNSGKGPALNISAIYGSDMPDNNAIQVPNLLSADARSEIQISWTRAEQLAPTFHYWSQDGRKFKTEVVVERSSSVTRFSHRHTELDGS